MTEDHRARRVADADKLWGAVSPYMSVASDAKMRALHNELMAAIDGSFKQHTKHRFQEPEIEVIKDISFNIIYVLDRMNARPRGFFGSIWDAYLSLGILQRIGTAFVVLSAIATIFIGGWKIWKEDIRPWWSESRNTVAVPAPEGKPSPKRIQVDHTVKPLPQSGHAIPLGASPPNAPNDPLPNPLNLPQAPSPFSPQK